VNWIGEYLGIASLLIVLLQHMAKMYVDVEENLHPKFSFPLSKSDTKCTHPTSSAEILFSIEAW
jgi:hypothetical protein